MVEGDVGVIIKNANDTQGARLEKKCLQYISFALVLCARFKCQRFSVMRITLPHDLKTFDPFANQTYWTNSHQYRTCSNFRDIKKDQRILHLGIVYWNQDLSCFICTDSFLTRHHISQKITAISDIVVLVVYVYTELEHNFRKPDWILNGTHLKWQYTRDRAHMLLNTDALDVMQSEGNEVKMHCFYTLTGMG